LPASSQIAAAQGEWVFIQTTGRPKQATGVQTRYVMHRPSSTSILNERDFLRMLACLGRAFRRVSATDGPIVSSTTPASGDEVSFRDLSYKPNLR